MRDIRHFTAQVRQSAHSHLAEIHYSSRTDPRRVSFTDRGKRIDVWQVQDEVAVLAALQLGAQKWGTLMITGPDEFKQLCAQIAANMDSRSAIQSCDERSFAATVKVSQFR
jgi:hypothetical protein